MKNAVFLRNRLFVPIHYRRNYWNRFIKRRTGCRPSRYLLCCGPFSLRSFYGGGLCVLCRFLLLILKNNRKGLQRVLRSAPLYNHFHRRQPNLFPYAFSGSKWYAKKNPGLPRRLLFLEPLVFLWFFLILCWSRNFHTNDSWVFFLLPICGYLYYKTADKVSRFN